MINIWIGVISMSILLTGFTFSLKISAINRTFLLLPSGIIEKAVTIIGLNEGEKPYYDTSYLEKAVQDYFVDNLETFVPSFSLAYHYFNQNEESSYLLDRYDGVVIGLRVPLILDNHYQNSLTFIIKNHE